MSHLDNKSRTDNFRAAEGDRRGAYDFPEGLHAEIAESAQLPNPPFVNCTGHGNRLIMESSATFGSLGRPKVEFLGNNNTLHIGKNCNIKRGHYRFKGDGMTIAFGEKTTVNGAYILCLEGASVTLGRDCMLSYEIEIRTSDAHSILDSTTMERVNPAQDVVLGDHVWVGKGVILMQGTQIAKNSIIGTRALVSGQFDEENVVIAGIPARVVTRGRTWDRRLL